MKLRNKKTGEIFDALVREKGGGGSYSLIVCDIKAYEQSKSTLDQTHFVLDEYETLAELNEEWEDYKPAKPKLEGDVSEIVRLWANLHGYTYVKVLFIKRNGQTIFSVVSPDTDKRIEFLGAYVADDFDAGKYTLDELCGEEEE